MEIKNKLTVTRREGEGITAERRGRAKLRNMCKGPTDKDNGVWGGRIEFGTGGVHRAGESKGGKWAQLY